MEGNDGLMLKWLYALPFLVAGLIVWAVWYQGKKRREAAAALAASMGLSFSTEGPGQAELDGAGPELFRTGHSRRARNLISSRWRGGALQFFDYDYTVGHGKGRQVHSFTLALIECRDLQVPVFSLAPENFLHKFGELFGFKDIDLEGFPVFSDKYRLTGPAESEVRAFFNAPRAAWFEAHLGLYVQGAPGHIVFFKQERQLPVEQWQGFMQEANVFAETLL
jgi:hypothetical protein